MEVPSQKIAYLDNNGVVSTLARINGGRVKHITKQWLTAWTAAVLLFVMGEKRRHTSSSSSSRSSSPGTAALIPPADGGVIPSSEGEAAPA